MSNYQGTKTKLMVLLSLVSIAMSNSEFEGEVSKFLGYNNVLEGNCVYEDYDYYVLSVQFPSKE